MAEQQTSADQRAALRERAQRRDEKGFEYTAVEAGTLTALCDDADALAGARAECAAWRALVEDTDHRLKRYNDGADDYEYITGYYMPTGIWHRFLAAARGADVAGIVAGLNPAQEGASDE